jgi:hypothetical protein
VRDHLQRCASAVALTGEEADRLESFSTGKPYIMRHPVATPAKARFSPADD